jgi:CRISPR system Cascade subunit CasB
MSTKFAPDAALGKQLADWWLRLSKDSANRAELKRCESVTEVMLTPAFQQLCRQLKPQMPEGNRWQEKLAIVAGLAAHLDRHSSEQVLQNQGDNLAALVKQLASDKDGRLSARSGHRPVVSELRFRRLIQREADDLYTPLIRIIRMLGGKANLFGLAESIFYWGDAVKKRWAFAYFPNISATQSH